MPIPCHLTVLVENSARGRGLLAEHGLSFWLEYGPDVFLLDTGQGNVLLHNASQLGVDLAKAAGIVLSHGHYDHTGRLWEVLATTDCPVYAHPSACQPRYARNADGACRPVGVAAEDVEALEGSGRLTPVKGPTAIAPGLFVTGPVPRTCDFEDVDTPFCLDTEGQTPDPLIDDQSVYYQSTEGVVALLGCAHSGVINTLRYIQTLAGAPVHTVIGGMHLGSASDERVDQTVRTMREMGVQRVMPMHCTGPWATRCLQDEFGADCPACLAGTRFDLPPALD